MEVVEFIFSLSLSLESERIERGSYFLSPAPEDVLEKNPSRLARLRSVSCCEREERRDDMIIILNWSLLCCLRRSLLSKGKVGNDLLQCKVLGIDKVHCVLRGLDCRSGEQEVTRCES